MFCYATALICKFSPEIQLWCTSISALLCRLSAVPFVCLLLLLYRSKTIHAVQWSGLRVICLLQVLCCALELCCARALHALQEFCCASRWLWQCLLLVMYSTVLYRCLIALCIVSSTQRECFMYALALCRPVAFSIRNTKVVLCSYMKLFHPI